MAKFARAPKMEAIIEPTEPLHRTFLQMVHQENRLQNRVVLESPEGHRLNCAIWFDFKASNNVVEFKALLASLRLAGKCRSEGYQSACLAARSELSKMKLCCQELWHGRIFEIGYEPCRVFYTLIQLVKIDYLLTNWMKFGLILCIYCLQVINDERCKNKENKRKRD